ncbi:exo-alpha-sialidase [Paraflavitalea soli]|uniref:exo-alpha-sialidase n=1 Tax=Paraflavitalea soli TaxID=2315862 RepID=A0A3B7MH27_9BACT|nr:sialidase family protein [Paraflavitalea soli]AXY72623.1 exo-alpha-sialidase [Paraflavitalea soli]
MIKITIIGCLLVSAMCGCKTGKQVAAQSVLPAGPVTTVVFEPAGEYAAMRIPALVLTQKGTLLAFCEGRIGSASDTTDMDLLLRRSTDGGKSWEPTVVIAARQTGATSNPTPIVDRDGTIHLLYQRQYTHAYYTRSTDDGKTWRAAADITYAFDAFRPEYAWQVLAPGPGHAIQLNNGRLLAPVWLRTPKEIIPQRTYRVAVIYSDDAGATWKRGAILPDVPAVRNPNESMAVQLEDGRVMMSIRNNAPARRRGVSYSTDGISNWTVPVAEEELFEPACMASIIRASHAKNGGKNRLLFVNPDSRDLPKYPRKNLTARISYDEGESWPVRKVIDTALAGYSDLAIDNKGTVYCLYEANTIGKGWNYSIVMKKFTIDWIEM